MNHYPAQRHQEHKLIPPELKIMNHSFSLKGSRTNEPLLAQNSHLDEPLDQDLEETRNPGYDLGYGFG